MAQQQRPKNQKPKKRVVRGEHIGFISPFRERLVKQVSKEDATFFGAKRGKDSASKQLERIQEEEIKHVRRRAKTDKAKVKFNVEDKVRRAVGSLHQTPGFASPNARADIHEVEARLEQLDRGGGRNPRVGHKKTFEKMVSNQEKFGKVRKEKKRQQARRSRKIGGKDK